MSQFIHHVSEKAVLFMLILVGDEEGSLSTQDINSTSIVHLMKDFSMIFISLYIIIDYCILIVSQY